MSQYLLYALMAILSGAAIAFQAPISARLGEFIGGPIWAALVSFTGSLIAGLIAVAVMKGEFPDIQIDKIKPWMLIGGFLGAMIVIVTITTVQTLGVTTMFAMIIAGQLCAALVLDQIGFLMPEPKPINIQKAAGIVLLVIGAGLILFARSDG